MTPQQISEQELPQPFRKYWHSKDRLQRDYEFWMVDGELYINEVGDDQNGLMHHWTLASCAGIHCFRLAIGRWEGQHEPIPERRDLPLVTTTGVRCFEILYSDDYETSVRDPKTGQTWVVHSG